MSRRERGRLVAAVVIAGLIAAFAVLNTDKVKVDWIFWTTHTALIVVILVSVVAGLLLDRLVIALRRRQRGRH